jgi:GNAT superfamily N-acetyltransferase
MSEHHAIEYITRPWAEEMGVLALNPLGLSAGTIEANLVPETGMWWVSRCMVQARYRNRGVGTQLLQKLCHMADKLNRILYLHPNPYDHTINRDRLIRFYARYGFKFDPAKNWWARAPKTTSSLTETT